VTEVGHVSQIFAKASEKQPDLMRRKRSGVMLGRAAMNAAFLRVSVSLIVVWRIRGGQKAEEEWREQRLNTCHEVVGLRENVSNQPS